MNYLIIIKKKYQKDVIRKPTKQKIYIIIGLIYL